MDNSPSGAAVKRILVVEDEPGYQERLRAILPKTHDLTICSSVEEAREKIGAERFDLVISDLNLFGMSGFEIINIIKQAGLSETCPVIICSCMNDSETRQRAMDAGASGFIPKPFNIEMVLPTVSALLK
jgi:DNA-binding response OmpR family regulator